MEIVVSSNIDGVAKQLDDLAKKQLPFATALALTRTAIEVQGDLKGSLTEYFTSRGSWVENSIRARPARKGHSPVSFAGSLYEPMGLHAEGGEKDAGNVPIWARAQKTDRTRPSKWPGKLADKRHFFLAPFQRGPFKVGDGLSNPSGVGLFQRIGSRKNRRHLKLWWVLADTVTVKADWPFWERSSGTVNANFESILWAALEQAMASSKHRQQVPKMLNQ